jgi:D-amino peptidase
MTSHTKVLLAITLIFGLIVSPASAQTGTKVYISADMEGVVGAVTDQQLGPSGFEYQRFRQFMTNEVNAAIEAAKAAGATEFVVSDSHGNGQNLLIDQLPQDITVVRAMPRPLGMMQGIDETFDAVVFIGYHSSTTNPRGVRAHTMSSATLAAVKLNGIPMPEGGINAAIAGHFGVPVVAISGDDAVVEEVQGLVPGVEGAVVKWSVGFHSARTLMPDAGYERIREAVTAGMAGLHAARAYRLEAPIEVDITFKNYRPAEVLAFLPIVERIDAHTVRFVAEDMVEAAAFMQFLTSYSASITP